jgi:hypothetical protein
MKIKVDLIEPLNRHIAPTESYFVNLLCLTPDGFTCRGESAGTQWHSIRPSANVTC